MSLRVTQVIGPDTFKVSGVWKWNGMEGNTVKANGYDAPEKGQPGYKETRARLRELLLRKEVRLKNPIEVRYGRLLCDVYLDGDNLASLFAKFEAI